jgi:hypothetical protein
MYIESKEEKELFERLLRQFPEAEQLLLELLAWCQINNPDKLEQIIEECKGKEELINLEEVDLKSILRNES